MKRESMGRILLGHGTGALFGFLLQRGRATRYRTMIGHLQYKDFTMLKIVGTATAVGAIGTQVLRQFGVVKKNVRPLKLGGITLGSTLFGAGMALLGYCPATTVAAVGEGRKDAMAGLAGMLAGAAAFVRLYPSLKPLIDKGNIGDKTLPELTRTPTWLWVAGMTASVAAGATALELTGR